MNGGVVANRYIVADVCLRGLGRLVVEGVDDGSILDVGAVADGNLINVTTQHSAKPYRAILANCRIANNHGRVGQKCVLSNRGLVSSYFFNNCHISKLRSKMKVQRAKR